MLNVCLLYLHVYLSMLAHILLFIVLFCFHFMTHINLANYELIQNHAAFIATKKQACDVMELFDKVKIRAAKYLCSEIKIFNSTS